MAPCDVALVTECSWDTGWRARCRGDAHGCHAVDALVGRLGPDAAGHDPAVVDRVIRLVDLAEYKRRQNPPGPKVTSKAFGRDRRLPITSRWREKPGA